MKQYEVVAEAGVDLNGEHYPQSHTFEFDTIPDHIAAAIADGTVAEVAGEAGATIAAAGKGEDSSASSSAAESDSAEEGHGDDGAEKAQAEQETAAEGDAAAANDGAGQAEAEAGADEGQDHSQA